MNCKYFRNYIFDLKWYFVRWEIILWVVSYYVRPFGHSMFVGQHPMESLLSVCPPVCPSIHSSLSFLKIGLVGFSDIAHDYNYPWHLVTDWARFLKKKFDSRNLGQIGKNQVQNKVFSHSLKFGSLVFLDVAYNDSLQQCLTSSRGKIHEKNFWPKFLPKGPKSGSKLGFLSFSQVWFLSFPLNCIGW